MRKIVLASSSPRRKRLMTKIGLDFSVHPSSYEEDMSLDLSPEKLAVHLAQSKARDIAPQYQNAIIIGADTFVAFRGEILGKPKNKKEAEIRLRNLSGKTHKVISGLTLIDARHKKELSRAVTTKIYFNELTDKEIKNYVNSGEPLDKAGAYAIQGLGSILVKKIEGDYYNVVGLPLFSLNEMLGKLGIKII